LSTDSTHNLFNESFQQYRRSIEQTKLKIVILGPARKSPGYDKRTEIREHLRSTNKTDDVVFPEEINVPPEVLPDEGHWSSLDFIIANAEIVFALLVDNKNVTGVLGEVTKYGDKKGFREKSFLILPRKQRTVRGSFLPQIWAAAEDYPTDRTLRYSDEEFLSCARTRDYVAAKVDLYRKRLRWNEFMQKEGMTTFEYS
jgi:hypothetical protein